MPVRRAPVPPCPPCPLPCAQDRIWEPRCDNGYPNVIRNPGDANGEYRLWYGCFSSGTKFNEGQGSDRTNAWMYANSSDGITWTKPNLGVYDLSMGGESRNKVRAPPSCCPCVAAWSRHPCCLPVLPAQFFLSPSPPPS